MRELAVGLFVALCVTSAAATDAKKFTLPFMSSLSEQQASKPFIESCIRICSRSFSVILSDDADKVLLKKCEEAATCTSWLQIAPDHSVAISDPGSVIERLKNPGILIKRLPEASTGVRG